MTDKKSIIKKYFDKFVKDLQASVSRFNASGKLVQSIKWKHKEEGSKDIIEVTSEDYIQWLKKTTPPRRVPYKALYDWVKVKDGLPPKEFTIKQFAWIVWHKIARQGIMVPNKFNPGDIEKPIDDWIKSQTGKKVADEIGLEFVREFAVEIESDILKDASTI